MESTTPAITRARYVGKLVDLYGATALVRDHAAKPHLILVQVDSLQHAFAHGWHIQARDDWEQI